MRVHVRTLLPCSVEQAWEAIQSTTLLMEVTPRSRDSVVIAPDPMPKLWTDAKSIRLRLPGFGERVINIELVDAAAHVIRTQESDSIVKRWQHRMEVQPGPQGQAYYSDTVDIDAGIFTLPVYTLAQFLYRYRHRGWLKIAKRISS
jgi:hypothetical protein